jgi:hypothetical protein
MPTSSIYLAGIEHGSRCVDTDVRRSTAAAVATQKRLELAEGSHLKGGIHAESHTQLLQSPSTVVTQRAEGRIAEAACRPSGSGRTHLRRWLRQRRCAASTAGCVCVSVCSVCLLFRRLSGGSATGPAQLLPESSCKRLDCLSLSLSAARAEAATQTAQSGQPYAGVSRCTKRSFLFGRRRRRLLHGMAPEGLCATPQASHRAVAPPCPPRRTTPPGMGRADDGAVSPSRSDAGGMCRLKQGEAEREGCDCVQCRGRPSRSRPGAREAKRTAGKTTGCEAG